MSPTKHPSSQITLGWSGAKSRLFLPIPSRRLRSLNSWVVVQNFESGVTLICVRSQMPALDLDNYFQGFDEKKWAAGEMFSEVKKSCVHPNILSDNMDQIKVCHSDLRASPDISDGFSPKGLWICFALYSFTFLLLSTLTQSALYWLSRKRGYFWSSSNDCSVPSIHSSTERTL